MAHTFLIFNDGTRDRSIIINEEQLNSEPLEGNDKLRFYMDGMRVNHAVENYPKRKVIEVQNKYWDRFFARRIYQIMLEAWADIMDPNDVKPVFITLSNP